MIVAPQTQSNVSAIAATINGGNNYIIRKARTQVIDKFEEYHSFLSNDEPSWVLYEGALYPSVSVAFQAARASDAETKEKIANVDSPDELFEIALTIEDPPDWEQRRLRIMEILIRDKFRRSLEMRERLRLTEEKQIVNRYSDDSTSNLFWGFVGTKGENQLGRILERIRSDINDNSDLKKWMQTKFKLETDKILLPIITLDVYKDTQIIETVDLKERSYYYMGQYKTNSVLLAHPSISRLHACIICEEGQVVRLIDFESKSGSFVNGEILDKLHDRQLKTGDILTFALSTRSYHVTIDYKQAEKELNQRFIKRQQEVAQLQRLTNPTLSVDELRRIMGFTLDDTLFVSSIPLPSCNELALRQVFKEIAKVKQISVPLDRRTGRPRGLAYVVFDNAEELRKAHLKSSKIAIDGVALSVRIADSDKASAIVDQFRFEQPREDRTKNTNTEYLGRVFAAAAGSNARTTTASKFDHSERKPINRRRHSSRSASPKKRTSTSPVRKTERRSSSANRKRDQRRPSNRKASSKSRSRERRTRSKSHSPRERRQKSNSRERERRDKSKSRERGERRERPSRRSVSPKRERRVQKD